MDVLGSASFVLQNEALTQNRLAKDVYALASGLRVRSAADDPSGYTIHESLDTKIAGLQQSVTNVQTANNLLNVAEGALSSVESILQRIRTLIVESNSDINSQNDLQNIQAEIDQLLQEVNKISTETSFNGLQLLNGQFQASNGNFQSSNLQVYLEQPPFPNVATGATGSNSTANAGQLLQFPLPTQLLAATSPGSGGYVPTYTVLSVVSASNNMIDPDSGTNVGPGILIQEQVYSTAGTAMFGPTPLFVDYSAVPDNFPSNPSPNANLPTPGSFAGTNINNILLVQLGSNQTGQFGPQDVGAQVAVLTLNPQQISTGHALNVNDGGQEGQTVSISLPSVNTDALGISGINVTDQVVTTLQSGTLQPQLSGLSSSNVMNASYAEIVVDNALQTVNGARAQIGAQTVALQQDANNDSVAIVNLTAASSNIRDANIGATVTDFTKQQILVNVGNSVLSQMEVSASQLTALLMNSFAGLGAAQGAPAATASGGGAAIA